MKVHTSERKDGNGNTMEMSILLAPEFDEERAFMQKIDLNGIGLWMNKVSMSLYLEDDEERFMETEEYWLISGFQPREKTAEDDELEMIKSKLKSMNFYDWPDFEGMSMTGLMEMMIDFAEDVRGILPKVDD